jgi:hypothetical protein
MASRISFDIALNIALKGKYYPQPTNHAGLPTHPVFCDYCGRGNLGGSWKMQDTPEWDICMQCYVSLQSSNNITSTNNTKLFPISGNLNQDFHNNFNNNITNTYNSTIPITWEQQSLHQDNYQSTWTSDIPGSYSNRIITSNDAWNPQ